MNIKTYAFVDFDGVVSRSSEPSKYIKNKIEKYVKKKLRLRDMETAAMINRELYNTYGHTFLGLRKLGLVQSLREFNECIYGDTHEYRGMALSNEEEGMWKRFLVETKRKGIEVQLLSNADKRWIETFVGYNPGYFNFHDTLELYEDPFYSRLIKPKRDIYELINNKYMNSRFYFIDDKLVNFGPVIHDINWNNLWIHNTLQNEGENTYSKICDRLFACHFLDGATELIVNS